ncbi:MAG: hypothetical protein JO202_08290 [Ktedonobacteraceae bacterium]|nr:hypothetical protein [Ktedonobacteraceae bacterium]
MTEQTLPVTQKIIITDINGDLHLHGWEQQRLQMKSDGEVEEQRQDGDTLLLGGYDGSLELWMPFETSIDASDIAGTVTIENVRQVELRDLDDDVVVHNVSAVRTRDDLMGDATFSECSALDVANVYGDLTLNGVAEVKIGNVGADLRVQHGLATLHCSNVGGDCQVQGGGNAEVFLDNVGGDLTVNDTVRVQIKNVGADCRIQGNANVEIKCGNVGGDFATTSAARVHLGNIGGVCRLRDVQGDVALGHIGSSVELVGVGGNLRAGSIGSDAQFKGVHGSIEVGHIGANLLLQADFPPDSATRLLVGGDVCIMLPENANLSISATVGGSILGSFVTSNANGNIVNLVYGDGAAKLELRAGGDLEIPGNQSPRSSSTSNSWSFLNDLGRDMGRLGRDMAREMSSAFNDVDWNIDWNVDWTGAHRWRDKGRRHRGARKSEERTRRARNQAEERWRHTGEHGRRGAGHAARIHVRINDREWRFDQERVNRIVEQARRAAAEGVGGALEAVEQALSNLHIEMPPTPPPPSAPPMPSKPMAPTDDTHVDPAAEHSEEQAAQDEQPTPKLNPEQEREAILCMIAEGRISPEEGDMLLEALGG